MYKVKLSSTFAGLISSLVAVITLLSSQNLVLAAESNCKHHTPLQYELKMPLYHWNTKTQPKGVVLAMHGLIMHGSAFEGLGTVLSQAGYLVYSTDMRGYGRLTTEYPHEFCSDKDCKQKVDYEKSAQDLEQLALRLKKEYPTLPLYLVGESLGAHMALRIANARPDLASGLVLSSPALRANHFIDKQALATVTTAAINFSKQLNLTHYMKRYASEDPAVVSELLADPLVRHSLNTYELARSFRAVNQTLSYVPQIGANEPVLVMQGRNDRCVRPEAVEQLVACLHSQDQKVEWFEKRGHILIETAYLKPDTISTLLVWLDNHVLELQNQARVEEPAKVILSDSIDRTRLDLAKN